ncbi:DNA polymerase I [Reticulomyxa filosa]|uniref:DNA polymerase I n=1 Tax=Reticulomyxa filosa TaxID=46433 RepID=X6LCQ5_RETFI|nr:DNA polymerase I [Reticulomyxa filosa]|eukprot:ETN98524.1 DNA polymerase I [Reticulomyxa filosa]
MVWADIAAGLFFHLYINPALVKIGYNCKLQLALLNKVGIRVKGQVWDVRIAHWTLTSQYNTTQLPSVDSIFKLWCRDVSLNQMSSDKINHDVSIEDQLRILPTGKISVSKICRKKSLETWQIAFLCMESPLSHVLMEMECHGVGFSSKVAQQHQLEMEIKLEDLIKKARLLAGEDFDLSSPQDCHRILFQVLKLPLPNNIDNLNCSDMKACQFQQVELELFTQLHPIVPLLVEHKRLSQFVSNFVKPLVSHAKFDKRLNFYLVMFKFQ